VANNKINNDKKCRHISGTFNCHEDEAVQLRAHRLMEHIQGFTLSHWMPPTGECLRHIAPAAAKVINFE
jgi:hypothetical protein